MASKPNGMPDHPYVLIPLNEDDTLRLGDPSCSFHSDVDVAIKEARDLCIQENKKVGIFVCNSVWTPEIGVRLTYKARR